MQRTLTVRHDRLRLSRPFRISRGIKTEANVIVVSVEQDGVQGWGEGVPYARYGETVPSALADVVRVRGRVEGGAGREELLALLPPGAARNAVDCALWDLEARLTGVAVAARIGAAEPGPMASALTVVIDTPRAMGAAAAAIAGAPLIKIKVDADDPAARIRAVRDAAPEAALIVDPNEGWDRALMERMQDVLVAERVALLEQPVPAGEDAWLADFEPLVPICADEAVHVASDLALVAERYQVVNVKLDKAGGLTEALAMVRLAHAQGFSVMVGCMLATSLAMAPAILAAQTAEVVDLDGPLLLAKDRVPGLHYDGSWAHPPEAELWG